MKRDPALQDLSRDHFTALVAARDVEWAITGHERPVSFDEATARFIQLWVDELQYHFDEEDANLGPVLAARADAAPLLARLRLDHSALRRMFANLGSGGRPSAWLEAALRLRAHVRWEEEELFAWLQASLTAVELESLLQASIEFRTAVRGPESVQAPNR